MPLHGYLGRSAAHDPGTIALVCGSTRCTYGELQRASIALASELVAAGLAMGDRVLVYLPNSLESVISVFGVSSAGGCLVAVDPSTPAPRLHYLISQSGATVVITSTDKLAAVTAATGALDVAPRVLLVGDDVDDESASFAAAISGPPGESLPNVRAADVAAIIYTSGSTGEPKGVTLTHGNFDAVTDAVSRYLRHTADDVVLCTLQLAFGYGLLQLLVSVRAGGRLVLRRGFGFAYDVVTTIAEERVTGFAGVPTVFALLLQVDDVGEKLSSLRYVTNAAAAMPASFIPRLRALMPNAEIFLMHGQTECLRTSFLPPEELDRRPTSIGKGMPGVELWLEDDGGQPPAPGDVGELMVRGANVMAGYWNDPDGTAAVVRQAERPEDRVLHTRDLFTADDDGYLYFVARTDDVIKCRGQKISPLEIEQLLYVLEGIVEVRVIGVPDAVLGQAIRVEIVLADGAELSEADVRRYLRARLEDFKQPQVVVFVDSLPKSSSGKIRRT